MASGLAKWVTWPDSAWPPTLTQPSHSSLLSCFISSDERKADLKHTGLYVWFQARVVFTLFTGFSVKLGQDKEGTRDRVRLALGPHGPFLELALLEELQMASPA